jgi:glycine/D-amino acid oxidase-like deaminating enzyme
LPTLTIDGRKIEVPDGTSVLDAARRLGVEVPTLCAPEGLNPEPSCLACVVWDEASGRFLPACATRAAEGMAVRTRGEEVERARGAALALLVAEHAGDCEAPCRRGCPVAVDGDAFIGFLKEGDVRAAAAVILERNPFPALTGRLCPAPCEKTCRRKSVDAAVSIKLLERFAGDAPGDFSPARARPTGKKIAVAGAGPAGLAAAFHLARLGHAVTVYEKAERAGGGLRNCLADGRLTAAVLEREIARVAALGARFVFGAEAGKRLSWEELARGHDALVVACGEHASARPPALDLAVTDFGIAADHETFAASRRGVFAIGSAVRKLDHSVHAFRQAWEAARAAHAFLDSGVAAAEGKRFDSRLSGLTPEEIAAFAAKGSRAPRHPATDAALSPGEAREEAGRCLECACLKRDACALREAASAYPAPHRERLEERPAFRLDVSHPDVVLEPGKCIKCGRCVRITRERGEPVGLAFIGRGVEMAVGAPFGRDLKDALTFTAAECVAACPTAALAWKCGKRNRG